MKNYILIFISISLLASCSKKEVNVRDHIDLTDNETLYITYSDSEGSQSDNVIYKSRADLFKVIENKNTSKADQVLSVYFDSYINDFLNNGNNLSSDVRSVVTDIINNLILISSNPDQYSKKLLDQVYYGCDESLKGCVKYDLYPKVKSSVDLIVANIKNQPFTRNSAARLLYVMQSYGGNPNPEMFLLIMENKSVIDEYLNQHSSLKSEGQNIINLAIRQVKSNSERSPEFKKRYCDSALESDWIKSLESPVKTYADKESILNIISYCKSSKENMYSLFKNRLIEETSSNEEISFLSRYSKKDSKFFSRYEVNKDLIGLATDNGSLELFVLDRFFEERISLSAAFELIDQFGKLDDLTFLNLINDYIKSYFSYKTDLAFDTITNELKKSIKAENGLSSTTLVDVTQNVSKASFEEWSDIAKKFGNLEGFVNQLFGSKIHKNSFSSESRRIYFSIKDQLEKNNYKQTVKQNIEHPVQLFISYFLSNLTGRAKFYFSWINGTNKYYDLDLRTSLESYITSNRGSVTGSSSLFLFSSDPVLRSSDLKVRSAFFKAAKFGLFEKIPFAIDDIIEDKPADYATNVKMLFEQIFSKMLENKLKRNTDDYEELKRKYVDRDEDGLNSIRTYCADPFNSPVEQSFINLNGRVSMPGDSDETTPLVFKAINDLSNVSYWTDWKNDRDMISEFVRLVNLAKPSSAQDLKEYVDSKFLVYEDPIIKMAKIKKKLKKEIFGTNCLKKTVEVERFRLRLMYGEFDSYIKSLYLVSNLSLIIDKSEALDFGKNEFDNLIREVSKDKDLEKEVSLLNQQVDSLFTERSLKNAFNVKGVITKKISKEDALNFLRMSLAAHNKSDLGNKVGYLAHEVPLDSESKNFNLVNYINITGNTLTLSRWDLYMKARDFMKNSFYEGEVSDIWPESGKVFPYLRFDLGGQVSIENLNSSSSSKKISVLLNTPYRDFLEKVKRKMFGIDQPDYFTWYKSNGSAAKNRAKMFENAFDSYLSLYKTGPIPLSKDWAKKCFNDNQILPLDSELSLLETYQDPLCELDAASPRKVVEEFKDLVDYLKLAEKDLSIISGLDSKSIYGEVLTKLFKVDGMKSNEWRWFDNFFFTNFASDQLSNLGRSVSVEAIPLGREITNFIDEVENTYKEENHILYHEKVYKHLRDRIKARHYLEMSRILRFENEIFKVEQEQLLNEVPIEIALTAGEREILVPSTNVFPDYDYFGDLRVLRAPLLPGEAEGGSKEYLSRSKGPYKWFWGNYGLFYHRQTNCFMLPEVGDFDAQYYSDFSQSGLSCRAKAEKFVEKLINQDRGFDGLIQSL